MLVLSLSERVKDLQIKKKMEKELLQRLLNSFSYATKMFSAITDLEGNCLLSSEQGDCEFCQLVKSSPSGMARCRSSYAWAGEQALKWKEPYIFKCHAGLISWVCPFFHRGKHIGNFICGQVMMWQPAEFCHHWIRELAGEIGQDPDVLLHSLDRVKSVTSVEIQAAADLVFIITSYVARSEGEIFDFQQKLRRVGSWIWAENKKQKDAGSRTAGGNTEQDLNKLGNQIFIEIRRANIEKAKKLLEQLVLQIFIQSKGQLEVIKGRSLELLSFLIRTSTEYGVKFGEVIHLSDLKLKEIDEADTVEKAVLWLLAVGNAFIELIAEKNSSEGEDIINRVVDYIQKNYSSESLSVKEIARASYISPAYLGQLFKKKMGYSLKEHINKVRIEQAKLLLRQTEQTIESVAVQTGFKERSYFCKVFKKITGLSPNEYRRKNFFPLA
ncbi:PocR ligand-binding domain-containing protein [Neomoorella mulderi]|uniref:Arabinose operon regulatory protein n=1 Tax=Moorella mulderi DSM 14980 TaxID=1122241 RepID=A0A151AWT9_9FIRM|nr:PocR ligand-binding domain-containing protein [Moorella mulderi]KYH32013.1 arabinose operon regulatory protein [Moorella mulderi DSM 14980]